MAPPLTDKQIKILEKVYYKDKNFFGRDKLYDILKDHFDISRRQVQEWLNKQEIHQLYAPAKKRRMIQNTILNEPYKQIGLDLMDMQNIEDDGHKYVFTAIDLFSKKAYAIPLTDKTNETVLDGMKEILKKIGHPVKSVRSDNGPEFKNDNMKAFLEQKEIKQIFSLPHKPQSNGIIERFNGELKRLINMSIKTDGDFHWSKELDTLTDNFNNVKHMTTGERPDDVEMYKNYKQVKEHTKKMILGKKQEENVRFKIGDKVRIKVVDERNHANFSKDIYTVEKVHNPRNKVSTPFYYLSEIEGKYYNNDLQKVDDVENAVANIDKYEISCLVKPVVVNGEQKYDVKWKGYKEITREPRKTLLDDVPKMLHQFEKEHNVRWLRRNVVYEE